MTWWLITSQWYLSLLLIGLVFFPISKRLLSVFKLDYGFAFSKTIGIILITYIILTLGTIKFLPFTQESLILILIGVILYYLIFYWKNKLPNLSFKQIVKNYPINIMLIEELLFITALFFWVYIRGQEPSIRGLEKFMDFGFMKSIFKATYFPPLDMWLSGKTINYYYFGHMSGSVLSKLSGISMEYAYNLILATIFATGITQVFSIIINTTYLTFNKLKQSLFLGILGTFIVNLGGNLHTLYTFTKGYPNEQPIPFWKILSWWNPTTYWYPNATRFIPFTIHEFPIYSYVVADLHGHVFDISFILLTIAILFNYFWKIKQESNGDIYKYNLTFKKIKTLISKKSISIIKIINQYITPIIKNYSFRITVLLGFLCSVHYMTNAFDGPIYILLTLLILFLILGLNLSFIIHTIGLGLSFIVFNLPFSLNFSPFVSGIGVNCSPTFLTNIGKLGPFLFEKGNCQISPLYMLLLLWGFFWISFIFLTIYIVKNKKNIFKTNVFSFNKDYTTHIFIFILFIFSTILIIIPEFFYMKDIYPGHFRANTMFKLGYQAFIMMGLGIPFTLSVYKNIKISKTKIAFYIIFFIGLFFISIYPNFAITSYYGKIDKTPEINGIIWTNNSFPEYKEVIEYLDKNTIGQPTILEAQGDSYTDYNIVSAYTGLPTIAGWWVHEWLWRGSSDAVGLLAPEIQTIYETKDSITASSLLKKYNVQYLIIGPNEREKYKDLYEEKFKKLGNLIFESTTGQGAKIYQIK